MLKYFRGLFHLYLLLLIHQLAIMGIKNRKINEFYSKSFDDIVENNSKDWNSQQSKKILDIINKIEIK